MNKGKLQWHCKGCKAEPGQLCRGRGGKPMQKFHETRTEAWHRGVENDREAVANYSCHTCLAGKGMWCKSTKTGKRVATLHVPRTQKAFDARRKREAEQKRIKDAEYQKHRDAFLAEVVIEIADNLFAQSLARRRHVIDTLYPGRHRQEGGGHASHDDTEHPR